MVKRVGDEFGAHMVGNEPADDFPGIPVNNGREIHPSGSRVNIGLPMPDFVRIVRHELRSARSARPSGLVADCTVVALYGLGCAHRRPATLARRRTRLGE
jgi:hypothetical protein